MLRNLYNTSRDVTPPLPPPPLALLRPPHQLLNARGSLWVSQSVSQSVRASDDGSWASPCPHARSEGAHKAQDRLWDLLLGARQHLDYKTRFFFYFFISVAVFFFLSPDFWAWETTCNHVSGSRGCEQAYWKYIQGEWNHTANKEINDQYLIGSLLSLICD